RTVPIDGYPSDQQDRCRPEGWQAMIRLITLYRETARQLDAVRGPGTARSEAIGMIITLSLAALFAIGLAAITGDA
ncbi:MAG: hypothetical protein U1D06_00040, partial [Paracoccaceae bacterium]|nr:hypothetical protein [Paracoccaceae bacterium]